MLERKRYSIVNCTNEIKISGSRFLTRKKIMIHSYKHLSCCLFMPLLARFRVVTSFSDTQLGFIYRTTLKLVNLDRNILTQTCQYIAVFHELSWFVLYLLVDLKKKNKNHRNS